MTASKRSSNRLILFTRYPAPGKVKTRLIPALGRRGAARLQRRMTDRMLREAFDADLKTPWHLEVRYDGGSRKSWQAWIGPNAALTVQGAGDIGQRMRRSLRDAFRDGCRTAVLIGSDIPGLNRPILAAAFEALADHDLVLGPARDGGYYLIGLHHRADDACRETLFQGIAWGSDRVLAQTLQNADAQDLSCFLLPMRQDIDRPADLPAWLAAQPPGSEHGAGTISIIIPAINEGAHLARTLSAAGNAPQVEIILADGGSHDDTRAIAQAHGAKVVSCRPPRSAQLNAGARAASGDVLLFLHADTSLPEGFGPKIFETLDRPGVAAGAFRLRIDSPRPSLRLIERYADHRSRHLQLPYGDQAIFMKTALFEVLGGFPDIPIMDDVELVRRARRVGRIETASASVRTSARRWERMGVFRTTVVNYLLVLAYFLGVPPARIARWYRREQILKRQMP